MAAAVHPIAIEIGSDFNISFQYLDINENPIDLSGYCITMLMKPTSGSGKAFGFSSQNSSLTLSSNGWTLLKDNSTINFALKSSFTYENMIDWPDGVYDLYITELSEPSKKSRIATGTISIIQNNFPECAATSCGSEDECIGVINTPDETPTPTQEPSPDITPTPTPTPATQIPDIDLCEMFCNDLDLNAIMYIGSGLNIPDNSSVSGTISIDNTRTVQNIELMINKLKHSSPQDLAMILVPPTGDKILLSAHNKIINNNSINGFSYIISNKAIPNIYINNVSNNSTNIPYVNILDKTSSYNFNDENLSTNLQSWIGSAPSGDWTLIINDHDIGVSGSIQDWRLIVTYEPYPLDIDSI